MPTDTYIQQRNESNRKARAFLQEVLAGDLRPTRSFMSKRQAEVFRSPTC